jgi:hypothetical protein
LGILTVTPDIHSIRMPEKRRYADIEFHGNAPVGLVFPSRRILMPRYLPFLISCILLIGIGAPCRAEKNLPRPAGTTSYAAMLQRLKDLAHYDETSGARRMHLESIGKSVKGRTIWMVTLHDSAVDPANTRRVFYLCRQHGHEPASTEGALHFIAGLVMADKETALAEELQRVTVYVVPMANPDGSEAFLRHNAHNQDINRDWITRREPETKALYRTVLKLRPDILVDQHEMYPTDTRDDLTEVAAEGSGANGVVIAICRALQDRMYESMAEAGLPVSEHWVDDTHPARLAHRYWAVRQGIPSILLETARREGVGRTVKERAKVHEELMVEIVRYLAEFPPLTGASPPSSPAAPESAPAVEVAPAPEP